MLGSPEQERLRVAMNTNNPAPEFKLAEDVTAMGMLNLEERVALPADTLEILREVMQATVEAGMFMERGRLLEAGQEN
jgi:hypothetical protein